MLIYLDNIIFSLQKASGVSVYWFELLKRFKSSGHLVIYEASSENIFRKQLNIPTKLESLLPVRLIRYLPFYALSLFIVFI